MNNNENQGFDMITNLDEFNKLSQKMLGLQEKLSRQLSEHERTVWEESFLEPLKITAKKLIFINPLLYAKRYYNFSASTTSSDIFLKIFPYSLKALPFAWP